METLACKAVNDFQFHSATRLFSAGFNAPRRIMEWNLPAADSQRSTEIFLRAWLKNWLIFRRRIEKRDGLVVFRWNLKVGSVIKTSVIAVFFAESQTAYFFPPGGDSEDFRIFLDNWWDQCRFSLEVEFFFLVLAVSTWKYEMTDSLYCSMAGRNIIRENKLSFRFRFLLLLCLSALLALRLDTRVLQKYSKILQNLKKNSKVRKMKKNSLFRLRSRRFGCFVMFFGCFLMLVSVVLPSVHFWHFNNRTSQLSNFFLSRCVLFRERCTNTRWVSILLATLEVPGLERVTSVYANELKMSWKWAKK